MDVNELCGDVRQRQIRDSTILVIQIHVTALNDVVGSPGEIVVGNHDGLWRASRAGGVDQSRTVARQDLSPATIDI